MSLKTWKAEFYPVPASKCKEKDALAHSLRRWLGFRRTATTRHHVRARHALDATCCALCQTFDCDDDCPLGRGPCERCYAVFGTTGNPEPMIRALRRAIKKQEGK